MCQRLLHHVRTAPLPLSRPEDSLLARLHHMLGFSDALLCLHDWEKIHFRPQISQTPVHSGRMWAYVRVSVCLCACVCAYVCVHVRASVRACVCEEKGTLDFFRAAKTRTGASVVLFPRKKRRLLTFGGGGPFFHVSVQGAKKPHAVRLNLDFASNLAQLRASSSGADSDPANFHLRETDFKRKSATWLHN